MNKLISAAQAHHYTGLNIRANYDKLLSDVSAMIKNSMDAGLYSVVVSVAVDKSHLVTSAYEYLLKELNDNGYTTVSVQPERGTRTITLDISWAHPK
jgi:hypothetical protein